MDQRYINGNRFAGMSAPETSVCHARFYVDILPKVHKFAKSTLTVSAHHRVISTHATTQIHALMHNQKTLHARTEVWVPFVPPPPPGDAPRFLAVKKSPPQNTKNTLYCKKKKNSPPPKRIGGPSPPPPPQGIVPALWLVKNYVPLSRKIRRGTPNIPGFFRVIKKTLLPMSTNILTFPPWEKGCTDVNQPLTERNRRGRGRYMDW